MRLPAPHQTIIITPPRLSDAPALVANMSDPAIYTFLEGPPFPYLPEHADQWLSSIKHGTDSAFEALRRANEEKPDEPPILLEQSPIRIIREVLEDGSDLYLGDIMFVRERYPDVDDKELKETLLQRNAARILGDPEIVWCIGGTSHRSLSLFAAEEEVRLPCLLASWEGHHDCRHQNVHPRMGLTSDGCAPDTSGDVLRQHRQSTCV